MSLTDGEVDTEFWQEPSHGGRPESASARLLLGVGVAFIALVGAFAGLAAAGLTGGKRTQEIAKPASTAPSNTAGPSTTAAPGSSSSELPTSTTLPPSSSSSSSPSSSTSSSSPSSSTTTTRPTTTRPTTTVTVTVPSTVITNTPQTVYLAAINVVYSQDSSGTLVIPKNGRALIQLSNSGGESGQWLFTLNAAGYRLSQTSGQLGPGESISVTVSEVQGSAHSGNLGLLVAPGDRYSINLRTP